MNDLTFNIYVISRYTHRYYARELAKLGITMAQFPYIMAIIRNDGISQEKLASSLKVSKSTTAAVIKQLVSAGLVKREVDRKDRRNFQLHATPAAVKLNPQIENAIDQCHQILTGNLSENEKAEFIKTLAKIRKEAETL